MDNAGEKGIGVIGMKTLAFGAQWPNPESRGNYSGEVAATALMKWALHNKNVAKIMVAFNNMEHMDIDFPVAKNVEYTAEEKKLLTDNNIELTKAQPVHTKMDKVELL